MKTVGAVLVLGMLVGAWVSASPVPPLGLLPCDSPEVEEAAAAAVDYINSLHKHGYKYALNRIEKVKTMPVPTGGEFFFLELDLLQTKCHVLDPTPLVNCTVRGKAEMTVEGDCDVAVKKLDGVLSVMAFKCKSEPDSREEPCGGCLDLLPLNHTEGLHVVDIYLTAINKQANGTAIFALEEVTRLTTQVVSGGFKIDAEFLIVETNCSSTEGCHHAICHGSSVEEPVGLAGNCKVFQTLPLPAPPATNVTEAVVLPAHLPKPWPIAPGNSHHKLTRHHLSHPSATGLVSESHESGEVPVVKREAPVEASQPEPDLPLAMGLGPVICPGRIRYF